MKSHLLWLDFETTGADASRDVPVEVAAILTDDSLIEVDRYHAVLVPRPKDFARILTDPFVIGMHRESGLIDEIFSLVTAGTNTTLGQVELDLLAMLDRHDVDRATLAGSGVGHFDKLLIARLMPALDSRLTYFVHDVGVLRRQAIRSTGADPVAVNDTKTHRAMQDIEDHLAEGRAYDEIFKALMGDGVPQ